MGELGFDSGVISSRDSALCSSMQDLTLKQIRRREEGQSKGNEEDDTAFSDALLKSYWRKK
jgi:hypothetical protein